MVRRGSSVRVRHWALYVRRGWDSSLVAPAPKTTPRWIFRFRADEWSRDKDRAVIAEGWDRFRPDRDDDQVIACAIHASSEVAARAQVLRVLGLTAASAD